MKNRFPNALLSDLTENDKIIAEQHLNQYWRDHRKAVREAKERAGSKSVDPQVFLTNPQLLQTVRGWIEIASEAYARKELDKTGISTAEGIEAIIRKANSYHSPSS